MAIVKSLVLSRRVNPKVYRSRPTRYSAARRPHQQLSLANIAYRRLLTRLQPSSGFSVSLKQTATMRRAKRRQIGLQLMCISNQIRFTSSTYMPTGCDDVRSRGG
jgi:hypothetical protein